MRKKEYERYLNQILNRNSEILYEKHPHGSLSIGEDEMSLAFRGYLEKWLLNLNCLDVGCGPQYKPAYIPRIPGYKWTGLDPLPGQWFNLRLVGRIENTLPVERPLFDNVVFATSLDHCYDPAKAINNIWYGLRKGGRLIIWTGIRPRLRTRLVWWKELWKRLRIVTHYGESFYVPLGCPDPFHRRYLTLCQIEKWTLGPFRLLHWENKPNRNLFLCFEKR